MSKSIEAFLGEIGVDKLWVLVNCQHVELDVRWHIELCALKKYCIIEIMFKNVRNFFN